MANCVSVGVDPGLDGALAIIYVETGCSIRFIDTPTLTVKSGKTFKRQMNVPGCADILSGLRDEADSIYVSLEKVQAMPGKGKDGEESRSMGATSAFNFGMGFGMWIGLLVALKIPYQLVHPATWKSKLMAGMSKEKDASRVRAMQMYPSTTRDLTLKKHHNRADALLLAEFGRRSFIEVVAAPAESAPMLF